MNTILTRQFLDACYYAKQILGHLPPIPNWMTPREIKVIDALHQLQSVQDSVRISDIAHHLDGTMPSITRMVSDLESHDVVTKKAGQADKRVHTISLTTYGEELYNTYVKDYHTHLTSILSEISDEDMLTTINVISKARALLKEDHA